uniref:Ankyrin repeat and zinc finger peptidyl tRNA hydrolase 1 n=1 Tax=Labrus bergylta TaxID=56723 RepID=A0A3Q3N972_9LABR
MTTSPEYRTVFDLCLNEDALLGLRDVNSVLMQTLNTEPAVHGILQMRTFCSFTFQMEHYKLDWHRFNLRLKLSGMPTVTAEEFETKTGAGDMSSISGSESDSEDESSGSDGGGTSSNVTGTDNESSVETGFISSRLSSKVVFQNSEGQYLSVYRCILQGKSNDDLDTVSLLKGISKKTVWVVLMTGGGHFAGTVFQGKDVIQHKTFHRYTVRAKRGTAQGLRDSQNRSHAPKSAGAALRRYNEAALVKDVQDLLVSWAEYLKEASAIFVRAPSYNKTIFFAGRAAPLDKKDHRVRTLPFATRRATFREAQRVHDMLSSVHIYGKLNYILGIMISFFCSLSPEVAHFIYCYVLFTVTFLEPGEENRESSDKEEDGEIQLEMVELTLGTLDLRESEIYPPRHKKRRRRRKNEESKMQTVGKSDVYHQAFFVVSLEKADESWDYGLKDSLFTACKVGDVDALCRLLQLTNETEETREQSECKPPDVPSPLALLNKPIDSSGFTLLHVSSSAAQKAVVKLLLDAGADPACRDKKGQTPYIVAPDKDTRNVFRKYMGENPDKYDYNKAQVPGPLTAEIESKQTEKKKAQKALKKQREKEQREEKRRREQEVEEKKKFASLSDREKRALAAEKRLAEQVAATGVNLSNVKRCWLCGESLLGKIPFQYLEYSFCTPGCVQAHRKANSLQGKT